MKKKLPALVLCICLAISFLDAEIFAASSEFSDVESNNNFYTEITWASQNNIITGYSDGTFRPWGDCSRTAFVVFLWRLSGSPVKDSDGNSYGDANEYFTDVSELNDEFNQAVAWAYKEGVTTGYSGKKFKPWNSISRHAAITMLWRLEGNPDPGDDNMIFTDVSGNFLKDSDYYKAILWAYNKGITTGYSDNLFKPYISMNRAAMVAFIYRINHPGTSASGSASTAELTEATVKSVEAGRNSITITWTKVEGAEGYYVYRKEKDGSWRKIATVESGSTVTYEDTDASYDTTYYYTVRAYSGSVRGPYKSSESVIMFSAPAVIVSNASTGVAVSWGKVSGASGYYVYRKTSSGDWSKIKTVTSGNTLVYNDTSASVGSSYYYTVRAYTSNSTGDYEASSLIKHETGLYSSSFGIDVSSWEGEIDWKKVKEAGVQFAIIRLGWGNDYEDSSQDDAYAEYNMTQCEKYGIPYGVYIYSYALTKKEVISEAEHTIRMLNGHTPTLGIWYDVEDTDYYNRYEFYPNSNSSDSAMLLSFCKSYLNLIKDAGYDTVGVYANKYYFTNIIDYDELASIGKIWFAQWYVNSPSMSCNIWQFSSLGTIDGIDGIVDLDILYGF